MGDELLQDYTSTGSKLFWHQEAMGLLREGKGKPIVTHIMLTDLCNFKCPFCSVLTRDGSSLSFEIVKGYLAQLVPLGLKAVILSGGGNPILWKDRASGADFNDAVDYIHGLGLQIGLITNGMPMKQYPCGRTSWKTVKPETLDKCTWIRVSLSGLDHKQRSCEIPDVDPEKCSLGFSYILHDSYDEPLEPNHGRVSTVKDLITPLQEGDGRVEYAVDRIPWLTEQLDHYVKKHNPTYLRMTSNCLEPEKIPERKKWMQEMCDAIDPAKCFVQAKPVRQPHRCFKFYPHPVLNSDGYTYGCDSVILSSTANHKFDSPWRVCHWSEVAKMYSEPVRPVVPNNICDFCVFNEQVDMIAAIVDGMDTPQPEFEPQHSAFV